MLNFLLKEMIFWKRSGIDAPALLCALQCFDYPGYVRLVLTVPEDMLREACSRIHAFCLRHHSGSRGRGRQDSAMELETVGHLQELRDHLQDLQDLQDLRELKDLQDDMDVVDIFKEEETAAKQARAQKL